MSSLSKEPAISAVPSVPVVRTPLAWNNLCTYSCPDRGGNLCINFLLFRLCGRKPKSCLQKHNHTTAFLHGYRMCPVEGCDRMFDSFTGEPKQQCCLECYHAMSFNRIRCWNDSDCKTFFDVNCQRCPVCNTSFCMPEQMRSCDVPGCCEKLLPNFVRDSCIGCDTAVFSTPCKLSSSSSGEGLSIETVVTYVPPRAPSLFPHVVPDQHEVHQPQRRIIPRPKAQCSNNNNLKHKHLNNASVQCKQPSSANNSKNWRKCATS